MEPCRERTFPQRGLRQPLLQEDSVDGSNINMPWLSRGPSIHVIGDNDESIVTAAASAEIPSVDGPFARLIAQSSSSSVAPLWTMMTHRSLAPRPTLLRDSESDLDNKAQHLKRLQQQQRQRLAPLWRLIWIAWCLVCALVGLLIATAWFPGQDGHYQSKPWLGLEWKAAILQQQEVTATSYLGLYQLVRGSSIGTTVFLIITSTLIPGLFVAWWIPRWIYEAFDGQRLVGGSMLGWLKSQLLMYAACIIFFVVWRHVLPSRLEVTASSWTDTQLVRSTDSDDGLVAYTVVLTCLFVAVALARYHEIVTSMEKPGLGPMATPTRDVPNAPDPSSTALADDDDHATPELIDETQDDDDGDDDDGLPDHSPLLPRVRRSAFGKSCLGRLARIFKCRFNVAAWCHGHACDRVVAYELALLTILLWVPALFWPLMQFEYQSWLPRSAPASWSSWSSSSTATTLTTTMTLSQLPALLFSSSLQEQGLGTLFVHAVVVTMLLLVPVALTILAAAAWLGPTRPVRRHWRSVLDALHPCHAGLPLVVTLILLVPGQGHSESLPFLSGMCSLVQASGGGPCWQVSFTLQPGVWWVLAQAVVLEAFVAVTLHWSE
jgi:hypothetical protein